MTYYIRNSNTYKIASDDELDISDVLPSGNYVVKKDAYGQFFLETVSEFKLPNKLYGEIEKKSNRIIKTFLSRSESTGILLSGDKGSGKTLLAKKLSIDLAKKNIATILINEPHCGDVFNKFIQSIQQETIIIFDEFEKVYDSDKQEMILTLMDGIFSSKKLFILTINTTHRINYHLLNRPGRIYYHLKYTGLEHKFIREYCEDTLNRKAEIDTICNISLLFGSFNFDILKAIVEEMNRFDISVHEALEMLNARPEDGGSNSYQVVLTINGEVIKNQDLENEEWHGNILTPDGIYISYKDSDDDWQDITFKPDDLSSYDSLKEEFVFKKDHDTLILKKSRVRDFNFKHLVF